MRKVLPDNDRFEEMNGGAGQVPEKALQAACLRRAFWDLSVWPYETLEWFMSDEADTPFTFVRICESLALDVKELRNVTVKHVAELPVDEELKKLRSRFGVRGPGKAQRSRQKPGYDLRSKYLGSRVAGAVAAGRNPAVAVERPERPASAPPLRLCQTPEPEVVVSIKGFGELLAAGQVVVEEYQPPVKPREEKPAPEPAARVRIHPWLG